MYAMRPLDTNIKRNETWRMRWGTWNKEINKGKKRNHGFNEEGGDGSVMMV
jgi:hypothetical protein